MVCLLDVDAETLDVAFALLEGEYRSDLGEGDLPLDDDPGLISGDIEVRDTLVVDSWNYLPVEVELDVLEVDLDFSELECEDGGRIFPGGQVEEVEVHVGFHLDLHVIGDDVRSIEYEVLDLVVVLWSRTLHHWKWDFPHILQNDRDEHGSNLLDGLGSDLQ